MAGPSRSLTSGGIFYSLARFSLPVLLTLFLQALYGGVDLLVVGQFASTTDVSGVSTGSMLLSTFTMLVTGLSMGPTVTVGEAIGSGSPKEAGRAVLAGLTLLGSLAVLLTLGLALFAQPLAALLDAPPEAMDHTVAYIRICGLGMVFIVAYNFLGAVLRGAGDAKTPLYTVAVACAVNIVGDLLRVAGFHLGAAGAAIATVAAQAASVLLSLFFLCRKPLPFAMPPRAGRKLTRKMLRQLRIGVPVALQELLVGSSFLVIQALVNGMGTTASAGVGVGEKVCTFIMLVPSAYTQSMSAFVAQNRGAGRMDRAQQALRCGILSSLVVGAFMGALTFWHGDWLAALFARDPAVVAAARQYLQAYAIDCLLTPLLFCFTGYFNGCEKTLFVMAQGIIGAFCVRIPVAWAMSRLPETSLFLIGLGTPASSLVQDLLCVGYFLLLMRKSGRESG